MSITTVAVIGAGSAVAPRHWAAFNAVEDVEVVAGVDINPAVRERIAHEWLVPVFPSVDALAQTRNVDLAVVCVPDPRHVLVVNQTLAAGWHTLVEKPMAASRRAAAALYRKAARRGRYLAIALQRRYMTTPLHELLADGTIDRVHEITAHWWSSDAMPEWRLRLTGRGGVIADRGIHLLSQADAFLSNTQPIRVTTRAWQPAGVRVETFARVVVDYSDGALVTISAGVDRPISTDRVDLSITGPGVHLTAPQTTYEPPDAANGHRPQLFVRTEDGTTTRELHRLLTVAECHAQLAQDVIAAVRHGSVASAQEVTRNLRLLSIVDAAYDSLQRGGAPVGVWRRRGRLWQRAQSNGDPR